MAHHRYYSLKQDGIRAGKLIDADHMDRMVAARVAGEMKSELFLARRERLAEQGPAKALELLVERIILEPGFTCRVEPPAGR